MAESEAFRYLQIRHALTTVVTSGEALPEVSPLEDRLLTDPLIRKAILLTYRKLINNKPDPLVRLRQLWETDLGYLEDDDWQEALSSPRVVAIPMRLRLIQLKSLHRTYLSAHILVKMGCRPDSGCLRGCTAEGTFFHIIWECPELKPYCGQIISTLARVSGKAIVHSPRLCLLTVWEATDLTQTERTWASLGFVLAKRNIAQGWGTGDLPKYSKWANDMDNGMIAEKDVFKHRGCPTKWDHKWLNGTRSTVKYVDLLQWNCGKMIWTWIFLLSNVVLRNDLICTHVYVPFSLYVIAV